MVNDHLILAAHPPDLYPVSGKRIAPLNEADPVRRAAYLGPVMRRIKKQGG